jgi:hypothetical protein
MLETYKTTKNTLEFPTAACIKVLAFMIMENGTSTQLQICNVFKMCQHYTAWEKQESYLVFYLSHIQVSCINYSATHPSL